MKNPLNPIFDLYEGYLMGEMTKELLMNRIERYLDSLLELKEIERSKYGK